MSIDKVNWPLIDGLKARLDFLNMLESAIRKLIEQKEIEEYRGSKNSRDRSKGKNYDSLFCKVPGYEIRIWITLFHQDATLGFLFEDRENKYSKFKIKQDDVDWKRFKLVKELDLKTAHFFPLDVREQEEELKKFIRDSVGEFKLKARSLEK